MAAVFSLPSSAGTTLFSVDDSGNGVFAGSVTSAGPSTGITNLTATGNTSLGDAAGDTTTITGHVDIDSDRTTAGSGLDIDGRINSASAAFSGLDITAVQLTTARSSGTVNGVKVATTSLAGDTGSVVYADYRAAAPTDGGGTVVHAALVVEAGHDVALDLSAAATGESDIVIGDNLASALEVREAANVYLRCVTTNGSEAVTIGKPLSASCLFASTEQTGTGGAQNIAHGLSATPTRVLIGVTEDPAGTGFDVAEGAHDATNVVVTVTTGVKFKVLALL